MPTLEQLQQSISQRDPGLGGQIKETSEFVLRNFNLGLARLAGIPNAVFEGVNFLSQALPSAVGLGRAQPVNPFPTGTDIQRFMSEQGMTFPVGEEPQTIAARTFQNLGAGAPFLPLLGLTAGAAIGTELLASIGGATGGKILEETSFGQKHPELARALGELAGGIGGGVGGVAALRLARRGGVSGIAATEGRQEVRRFFDPRKRATKRIKDIEPELKLAITDIQAARKTPEGRFLVPAQAAGTKGLARLGKTVERDVPESAGILVRKRVEAIKALQKQFVKTGDVTDARNLLQAKMNQNLDEASVALRRIDTATDPAAISTTVENKLRQSLDDAREAETRVWSSLRSDKRTGGTNIIEVYKRELNNLTEGADPKEIVPFIRTKLGRINKEGKLVGGKLFSEVKGKPKVLLFDAQGRPIEKIAKGKVTAEAKALHQFYSVLGRKVQELSIQRGQANKIRILKDLRNAALEDLDAASVGGDFRDAIQFSRELNERFTRGAIGRVLGFERGDTPSISRALEEIVGTGGLKGKEAIQQALNASPSTKKDIEDFLRARFVLQAKNNVDDKINVIKGRNFLDKDKGFGVVLDEFPELKRELELAVKTQRSVDDFAGVADVSRVSPLARERAAAGMFLRSDPGTEMATLLGSKNINRTNFLTDLVKETKKDASGDAFRGLQNAFSQELYKQATNPADEFVISGSKILNRLNELQQTAIKSGLFTSKEFSNLRRIGVVFKRIELELKAVALEGVINDLPSKLILRPVQVLAARAGGRFSQASMGGSLQTANIFSTEARQMVERLTNDRARNMLVQAVFDNDLMLDLLKDASKLSVKEQDKLFSRILDKMQTLIPGIPRIPITAGAPAAASAAASVERQQKRERIRFLQQQIRSQRTRQPVQ